MFQVQEVVDRPKVARVAPPPRKRIYPFETMEIGHFFFVPLKEGKTKNTLSTHASSVGKLLGKKFHTQLAYMIKNDEGLWETAHQNDEGAIRGVYVERTA
jgi:hypothetical protein